MLMQAAGSKHRAATRVGRAPLPATTRRHCRSQSAIGARIVHFAWPLPTHYRWLQPARRLHTRHGGGRSFERRRIRVRRARARHRRREEHPLDLAPLPGRDGAARCWRRPAPARRSTRSFASRWTWRSSICGWASESGLDLLPRASRGAPRPRRGGDHRLRHLRDRGGGDQARRARLPAQAVHAGADPARGRAAARAARSSSARVVDLESAGRAGGAGGGPRRRRRRRCAPCSTSSAQAAAHDVPVLLRGENGTGKGVLARVLHSWSARAAAPFVTVNCPTLTDELLASELFGHARGAFTGAVRDQPGKVEAAERGTALPRRDRRDVARAPGQAAPLRPGEAVRARGRDADAARRTCACSRRPTATSTRK